VPRSSRPGHLGKGARAGTERGESGWGGVKPADKKKKGGGMFEIVDRSRQKKKEKKGVHSVVTQKTEEGGIQRVDNPRDVNAWRSLNRAQRLPGVTKNVPDGQKQIPGDRP